MVAGRGARPDAPRDPEDPEAARTPALHLYRFTHPAVLAAAGLALAAGLGEYSVVTALGQVAKAFGHPSAKATFAEQAGLSASKIGVGLAIIRFASIGGLTLSGLADRLGRRAMMLGCCAAGLALTVLSAASPGYWWFVALFALGRPPLSATGALSQVAASEQTATGERAKAVGLVAAAYAVGGGLSAVLHGLGGTALGFRGLFALAAFPLVLLPLLAKKLPEPERFQVAAAHERRTPVFGALAPAHRRRLAVLVVAVFAIAVVTGPANSFVFLYGENVLHLSGAVMATMVVCAGVVGLGGLFAGRWLADHWGRRPTVAVAVVALTLSAILAYSGSRAALLGGYVLGILSGSIFAPGAGAFVNELFPTDVRASATGWQVAAGVLGAVTGLLVFGALAGNGEHYSTAAALTFAPVVLAAGLFFLLPETRGRELEELWPDPGPGAMPRP